MDDMDKAFRDMLARGAAGQPGPTPGSADDDIAQYMENIRKALEETERILSEAVPAHTDTLLKSFITMTVFGKVLDRYTRPAWPVEIPVPSMSQFIMAPPDHCPYLMNIRRGQGEWAGDCGASGKACPILDVAASHNFDSCTEFRLTELTKRMQTGGGPSE